MNIYPDIILGLSDIRFFHRTIVLRLPVLSRPTPSRKLIRSCLRTIQHAPRYPSSISERPSSLLRRNLRSPRAPRRTHESHIPRDTIHRSHPRRPNPLLPTPPFSHKRHIAMARYDSHRPHLIPLLKRYHNDRQFDCAVSSIVLSIRSDVHRSRCDS